MKDKFCDPYKTMAPPLEARTLNLSFAWSLVSIVYKIILYYEEKKAA